MMRLAFFTMTLVYGFRSPEDGSALIEAPGPLAHSLVGSVTRVVGLPNARWAGHFPPAVLQGWDVNVQKSGIVGIAKLLSSRAPTSLNDFVLHTNAMSGHRPIDNTNEFTFYFDAAKTVTSLVVNQHGNGITQIEGFAGDSAHTLQSVGTATASILGEFKNSTFEFPRPKPGKILRIVITRVHCTCGYAIYRAMPFGRNAGTLGHSQDKGTLGHSQDIDNGGWHLVRRVEQGKRWHPARDQLRGTDAYGTRCGESSNCTFSVDWSAEPFDEFLFSSGNGKYWLVTKKDQALGWYSNAHRQIMKSSINSKPYTARWYRRQSQPEDPWIGLKDHGRVYSHKSEVNILYGEDSSALDIYGHNNVLKHGGANVYIRDSKYWTGEGVMSKLSKQYDAECKICISKSCMKKCQQHHEHSKLSSSWSTKKAAARKELNDANAKKIRYEAQLKEATTKASFHARKAEEWKAAMDAQHLYDRALESLSQEEHELKEAETAEKESKTKKDKAAAALAVSEIKLKIAEDKLTVAARSLKSHEAMLRQTEKDLDANRNAHKGLTTKRDSLKIKIQKDKAELDTHKKNQTKHQGDVYNHRATRDKHASEESKHTERAAQRRKGSKHKRADAEHHRQKAQKTHYKAKRA